MTLQNRFGFEYIDCRHTRASPIECTDQGFGFNQFGARGVDQQCRCLHAREIVQANQAAGLIDQSKMQGEHVALREKIVAAGGRCKPVEYRFFARRGLPPDDNVHAKRLAVLRHQLADLSVAPDAQRLSFEDDAQTEICRHRASLESGLLPRAVLEVAYVLRQAAHGCHDERPGQLGRSHR